MLFTGQGKSYSLLMWKWYEMLDVKRTRALIVEGHGLEPTLQVGKQGVTPHVIGELSDQLKRRKLVKVKLLSAALRGEERERVAEELAEGCRAYLVELRGNTALFFKP